MTAPAEAPSCGNQPANIRMTTPSTTTRAPATTLPARATKKRRRQATSPAAPRHALLTTSHSISASLIRGGLQLGDDDAVLGEHGLLSGRGACRVGIAQQLVQPLRGDLPAQSVRILEPPAHRLLAATGDEPVPEAIGFGLVLAGDAQRHRLVELEVGGLADRAELRTVHAPARQHRRLVGTHPGERRDLEVVEEALVAGKCGVQVALEPEAGGDHGVSF